MDLRLLQIVVCDDQRDALASVLDAHPTFGRWDETLEANRFQANVLSAAQHVEALTDQLTDRLGSSDTYRVVVLTVDATVPLPDESDEPRDEQQSNGERISREELYTEVTGAASVTRVWLAMVALSSIVAAVGLMRDNIAMVIGAMVIAPLLGPNVAMALATALGDLRLGRRALIANLLGMSLALAMSIATGLVFQPHPEVPSIASRSVASVTDIVVGLAAGAAGTLAFTTGISATLVGVMVAVALLPPTVVCGLMIGTGHWDAALAAVNVICINLAGVATFLVQGIRPRTYREADVARRAATTAVVLWVVLLIIFAIIIFLLYDRVSLWESPS